MARIRYHAGQRVRIEVSRPLAGTDTAQYLAARLSLPINLTRRLLAGGCARIAGTSEGCGPTLRLPAGAALEVTFPDPWPPHLEPVPMDLRILHEDDWLVALDKPPGVVVHPARGHMDAQTLQNGVLYRYRASLRDPDATIGPAHRLDKDTSGVVIFSRTRDAYRALTRAFAEGEAHKEYLLLCDGRADFDMTEVAVPLGIDPEDPSRGAVVPIHDGGKAARTEFHVLGRGDDWTFLRAVPHTGRPHQVRLHAAHLGLPLVADGDYNPRPGRRPMKRQALHASRLSLPHPSRAARVHFVAPFPDDMAALLSSLGGNEFVPAT